MSIIKAFAKLDLSGNGWEGVETSYLADQFEKVAQEAENKETVKEKDLDRFARCYQKIEACYAQISHSWFENKRLASALEQAKQSLIQKYLAFYKGKLLKIYQLYISCEIKEKELDKNIDVLVKDLRVEHFNISHSITILKEKGKEDKVTLKELNEI